MYSVIAKQLTEFKQIIVIADLQNNDGLVIVLVALETLFIYLLECADAAVNAAVWSVQNSLRVTLTTGPYAGFLFVGN